LANIILNITKFCYGILDKNGNRGIYIHTKKRKGTQRRFFLVGRLTLEQ